MQKLILFTFVALTLHASLCRADGQADLMKGAAAEISKKCVSVNDHYYGCDFYGKLFDATKIRFNPFSEQLSEIDQMNGFEWRGSVNFSAGAVRYFKRSPDGSKLMPTDWQPLGIAFFSGGGERRNGKTTFSSFTCASTRQPTNAELKQIGEAVGITIPLRSTNATAETASDDSSQAKAPEADWVRPGTKEAADVEGADAELTEVYKRLMSSLNTQQQKTLRDEERAWIKWRDAEIIRTVGPSRGGSGYREDYRNTLADLTRKRTAALKDYSAH